MATIDSAYKNADSFGRPAFEVLDDYKQSNLLAGGEPNLEPSVRVMLADSQTLAQWTVVGLDANRKLVKAAWNATEANAIKPIGVLAHAVNSGASNTTVRGEVFLTGVFNIGPDSPLVWDSSFDTDAKKELYTIGNPNLIFRRRTAA
jgi:hypothetical protein